MSNTILSVNATNLAKASPGEEMDIEFIESLVAKAASRAMKGQTTRSAFDLSFNKLKDSAMNNYRAAYPQIYGRSDRLPGKVYDVICDAVNACIDSQLKCVHRGNALSVVTKFHHDVRNSCITERVIATGENILVQDEQLVGVLGMLTDVRERLKKHMTKGQTANTDMERWEKTRQSLENRESRLMDTESNIRATIARLKPAPVAETPKTPANQVFNTIAPILIG